jgi:hypothetical protein
MAVTSLTVDVYCTRSEGSPSYRIFVDDELLTERTWVWPAYENYVTEHVDVDVAAGAHRLEVKECNCDAVFYVQNITVNGKPNNGGLFFT